MERAAAIPVPGLERFIRENEREILARWERAVRELPGVRDLTPSALEDRMPHVLARVARLVERPGEAQPEMDRAAETHALDRLAEGFDLEEVLAEYELLREALLEVWAEAEPPMTSDASREATRVLRRAVDEASTASVRRYMQARDRALQAFDDISAAALESRDLDTLLSRLLTTVVESTPGVDTAAILLRDGDELHLRAGAGLAKEDVAGFSVPMGEGFAGTVASTRKPMHLRSASSPLVRNEALRRLGVRALFGVPLLEAGEAVGVAYMGSLTTFEFSEQECSLFLTLANRASAAIALHLLRESAVNRAEQQAAVAALGHQALVSDELPALLEEATRVVATTLRCELTKVLELLPEREEFVLRAGIGWAQDQIGHATVPAQRGTQAGYTLASREPVLVHDLRHEGRFLGAPLLREAGAVSGITVVIHSPEPGAEPYGVLSAHTRTRRRFTPEEASFLRSIANVIGAAVGRARAEEERRSAERETEEAMRLLDTLLETAPVGLAFWDQDLRYVRLNTALAEMNGHAAEAHLGRTVSEMIPGELGRELTRRFRDVLKSGRPALNVDMSGETPAAPGKRRHWLASYYPVPGAGGEPIGVGGVMVEITDRKETEDKLRFLAEVTRQLSQSIEYEATLARVARLAVPRVADWCAVVLLADDGALQLVAMEAADPAKLELSRELLERFMVDQQAEHGAAKVLRTGEPDLVPDISNATLAASRSGSIPIIELLRRAGFGSYMAVPLRARGRSVGAMSLAATAPGRRFGPGDLALAEELARRCAVAIDNARLYLDAQNAIRARDQVLAFVSHDLKNPLSAILMSAALLERGAPFDERGRRVRKRAETIHQSAERMNRLIHDLLDISSIESGRLAVELAAHAPGKIAEDAVESIRLLATERGVDISAQIPEGLPEVVCDGHRILQVLGNLLGNAVKVTGVGGTVMVGIEARGDEILFEVTDTGPGISAEDLSRIFERYWRGPRTRYAGTGLGLAIARGIVEAHGGRIWAESKIGKGSVFRFALPRGGPRGQRVDREPSDERSGPRPRGGFSSRRR